MEPESTREVFRGRFLRVEVESWPAGEREVVRHPGAAAVVALTPAGDVLLVLQPREPIRQLLLEIPAGVLDRPGEEPSACAARELEEETGFRASRIDPLGVVYTSPGFADERIELFLAETSGEPAGSPERSLEVVAMPFEEALERLRGGRIRDAKTVVGLLLAAERLTGEDGRRAGPVG